MTNITIAIIMMCNTNWYKFKTPEITEQLAFVKCYHEVQQCVKWNGDVEYCEIRLNNL
jgi:hypothetical protein